LKDGFAVWAAIAEERLNAMMLVNETVGERRERGGREEGGRERERGQAYGGGLDDRADHTGAEVSLTCRHLFCNGWIVSSSPAHRFVLHRWESRRRT
jgi:hypothetical protein